MDYPNQNTRSTWSTSCISSTFCLAVTAPDLEEYVHGTAIRYRDGSWQAMSSGASRLPQNLSCVSTSFCVAAMARQAATWTGTTWSATTTVVDSGVFLHSLDCTPNLCIALSGLGDVVEATY